MSAGAHFNATYRLQLSRDFTFYNAINICDYLQRLGITHLYLSPVFEALPGSAHGYDMTDFSKISEERGGEEGLRALAGKLAAMDPPMEMIIDFAPNHMAANSENPYWADVLENGRRSRWWPLFDFRLEEGEKLYLPVLGSSLDEAIASGMLNTGSREGKPVLIYGDRWFPLREGSADPRDQHYELVNWKEVFEHLPYRRFFDINDLVSLRMEDPEVFDTAHDKLFSLVEDLPCIAGVRVDHIDGLYDPATYLKRLAERVPRVWVEKILGRDEQLPDWPVSGTTGYEFIDRLNMLLVDYKGFERIDDFWLTEIKCSWKDFSACVKECKKETITTLFPAELERLAEGEGSKEEWLARTVELPVYRTYETGDEKIQEWQQLSGPAMAKGLEDTAHYRYTPLLALNEVGCEVSLTATGFFRWENRRGEKWPETMNATSTHDTKRSEDARARLYALANEPEAWITFFQTLPRGALDPQTAWFFYQTLVAVWPADGRFDSDFASRISAYMKKAMREAKSDTNWHEPDENYEAAVRKSIVKILDSQSFRHQMDGFVKTVSWRGCRYSLATLTLKTLAPGVPDFYQGSELWDFSLVDPDNRRPVDYGARVGLMQELDELDKREGREALLARLTDNWTDGGIKFWLTKMCLSLRSDFLAGGKAIKVQPARYGDYLSYFISCEGSRENALLVSLDVQAGRLEKAGGLKGFSTGHDVISGATFSRDDLSDPARLFRNFPVSIGTISLARS